MSGRRERAPTPEVREVSPTTLILTGYEQQALALRWHPPPRLRKVQVSASSRERRLHWGEGENSLLGLSREGRAGFLGQLPQDRRTSGHCLLTLCGPATTFSSVLGPELKISVLGTGPAKWRHEAAHELPGAQVTVVTGASRARRLPIPGGTLSPLGKDTSQLPIVQSERRSRSSLRPQVSGCHHR